MIKSLTFFMLIALVSSTTNRTKWTRKKPAYWEFPEIPTTEKPDISGELCKSVNIRELGDNITEIVTKPRRGLADPLMHSVVTYVLTLHRFIRKSNTTDDIAIKMARDLIQNNRPKFMDMELDIPVLNLRVGFDKYELQHFQWVMEDIHQSWDKLKGILFGPKPEETSTTKLKTDNEESVE